MFPVRWVQPTAAPRDDDMFPVGWVQPTAAPIRAKRQAKSIDRNGNNPPTDALRGTIAVVTVMFPKSVCRKFQMFGQRM